MGNKAHLAELLKGVGSWNRWRATHSYDFKPDLSLFDLRTEFIRAGIISENEMIPLARVNFREAHLQSSSLERSDLAGASLRGAQLRNAILTRSYLDGAFLGLANLEHARLQGVDFGTAVLLDADLRAAFVSSHWEDGTPLDGNRKIFNADLSGVRELTQKQLDSMQGDSGTRIPNDLTRPAHWPDLEEPEAKVLASSPPPALPDPFIFLSYASPDRALIDDLRSVLVSAGLPVWWDQDIVAGSQWRETIADRLIKARAILTLWTEASTASPAVIEEAATAQQAKKLVHARMDSATLPYGFAETQYVDLREWDGTANDPTIRKLIQALQDRIDPPAPEEMKERLGRASPIAFVVRERRLSPVDTPPNTAPVVDNRADLQDRLTGLRQRLEAVIALVADPLAYQLPEDLRRRVAGVQSALHSDPLTWYALDDAREALMDCVTDHDGKNSWNDGVYRDVLRIDRRIRELQPLLQPRQIPAAEPGAKPPEPDPIIHQEDVPEAVGAAREIEALIGEDAARDVLDASALDLITREIETVKEAEAPATSAKGEVRRFQRLRRGIRALAYAAGGIVAAVGTGVAVNLLTAPEAAVTLAARLQPILDRLISFFL